MTGDHFGVVTSEIVQDLRDAIPGRHHVGTYTRCRENIRVNTESNKVSMLALRQRSRTFALKVETRWYGEYTDEQLRLAASPDTGTIRAHFAARFQPNPTVEAVIAEHRPRVVLFPITGVEATGWELVTLSRRYGFKTVFLVNGWDNLSSKGVFPLTPDYLGVWGPAALVDAVELQGMAAHRVVPLGCARYEPYLRGPDVGASPLPFPYVLFAGATTACDELTPLHRLDEAMDGRDDGLRVVYRPHPWREPRRCADHFRERDFRHVVLDPHVADAYHRAKSDGTESVSARAYPSLDEYPRLLAHARLLVSPMSSLTLEAGLFSVPSLILAHDDGVHPLPPSKVAAFRHAEGSDDVPGWFHARSLDEIGPLFRRLVTDLADDGPERRRYRPVLSAAMKRYLHHDGRLYAERLEELVRVVWETSIAAEVPAPAIA